MRKQPDSIVRIINLVLILLVVSGCGKEEVSQQPSGEPQPAAPVSPGDGIAVTGSAKLSVVRATTELAEDPYSEAWRAAPFAVVPMMPQQQTMPVLDTGTITELIVQSMHDGKDIAWRISWADATPDGNVDVGRFTDAVAIQFPLDPGASPTMGHIGGKVQIIHWKALWQKDIDTHFQDVQDVHPNFWSDLYWFAEGKWPFPIPEAFQDPTSLQWFVAQQAGNPMAAFSRTSAVEELVAEGFGTLTHQPNSASTARGVYKDGRWAVVIRRPLKTDDPLDAVLNGNPATQIGFAVWDGSKDNVGGRKHWSNWTPLEITQ